MKDLAGVLRSGAAVMVLSATLFAQTTSGCPQTTLPLTTDKAFAQSADAQKFHFSQIDLDLLKQVDAFDQQLEEKGLIYRDPLTDDYIQRVGCSVTPPYAIERVAWRFHVVRDPIPNAFALPNGSVYINSGMLSRLENEAQLAGVLAHEVTHAANRHTYLEYHDMRKKAVAIHVIFAAADAAAIFGPSYAAAVAFGNVLPLAIVATMFGYRRELEHESDVYAVRMLHAAGYDAAQMSKALELLKKGPEVDLSRQPLFWADHPKLEARVKETAELAAQLHPADSKVEDTVYVAATRNAIRQDASLALMLQRPRTAVAIAKRLVAINPQNADNFALLGDAYRALGGRTPEPTPEEQTDKAKGETRKLLRKSTPQEYEQALMRAPGGSEHWAENCRLAEQAFAKAIELDARNAAAHRGRGVLLEAEDRLADAAAEFSTYLELAPEARDARQIRQRLDAVQKKLSSKQNAASEATR